MAAPQKTLPARVKGITLLHQLGPGLITGAADDDPSGIATYSQGGAQFGFNLLWTLLLTFPLMVALLFIANTINVGADLAAMGEAAKLVTGFGQHEFTILFALVSLGLQLFIPYRRYARF